MRALGHWLATWAIAGAFGACLGDPPVAAPPEDAATTDSSDRAEYGDRAETDAPTGDASQDGASNDGASGDGQDAPEPPPDAPGDGEDEERVDACDVESGACCAKDCLGGACVKNTCQPLVLVPSENVPWGLAVDPAPDGGVYYTTYAGASVTRVEKDGSRLTPLATFPIWQHPVNVTRDATKLYVTTFNESTNTPVYSMNPDGTQQESLGTWTGPWGIALRDQELYFSTRYDDVYVGRILTESGTFEPVHQDVNAGDESWDVAVDDEWIYWTTVVPNRTFLYKRRRSGGPETILAYPNSATTIALDSEHVYWADLVGTDARRLYRIKKDGSSQVAPLLTAHHITAFGIDAGYVYYLEYSAAETSTLFRAKTDGSNVSEKLAGDVFPIQTMAFDASAVYWTNPTLGLVMKLAK